MIAALIKEPMETDDENMNGEIRQVMKNETRILILRMVLRSKGLTSKKS